MKVLVVGLGVQGNKRKHFAGNDFYAAVDPENNKAEFSKIEDVPLDKFDAVLCCIPDEPKIDLLTYLISNEKHVLVEKPLWSPVEQQLLELEQLAKKNRVVCYTAYNHRFEPHFLKMRDLIKSGELGRIYHIRLFYGNGTARLVRNSPWRDKGSGVLHDLGSHLLDITKFWFGDYKDNFEITSSHCYENVAPDHVVMSSNTNDIQIECEMSLLSWRNHFSCDLFAEKGSAHINSLCKWGPSEFCVRRRVLPSGRPDETNIVISQEDPTWKEEYQHFLELCRNQTSTDLSNDIWINGTLQRLSYDVSKETDR